MKHYRIQINDRGERAVGVLEMARLGRVVSLRDHQFVVQESALAVLDKHHVTYKVLREDDPEDALRAVRDSAAAPV